jgi:hypothetical protein
MKSVPLHGFSNKFRHVTGCLQLHREAMNCAKKLLFEIIIASLLIPKNYKGDVGDKI